MRILVEYLVSALLSLVSFVQGVFRLLILFLTLIFGSVGLVISLLALPLALFVALIFNIRWDLPKQMARLLLYSLAQTSLTIFTFSFGILYFVVCASGLVLGLGLASAALLPSLYYVTNDQLSSFELSLFFNSAMGRLLVSLLGLLILVLLYFPLKAFKKIYLENIKIMPFWQPFI